MTLSLVRPVSADLPAGFLLRVGDNDLGFVQRADRGLIRGAILSTRCLSLPNGGHLLHTVRTMRIRFLMDPDTAVLVDVNADNARAAWLQAMPAAATITSLPIVPGDLADDDALQTFTRAVASTQSGAGALSAGYFRIASPDDPWRDVNRRLLDATLDIAAGRPVCARLELTLDSLLEHDLARLVAPELAGASVVVLRVAGLRAATASEDHAFAVLAAVAALRACGPPVVLDCVGTLGAAALPVGALAFSNGVNHHRSVPLTRVHTRPPSARPLGYEVPLEFRQLPRDDALQAIRDEQLEACGVQGCRALDESVAKILRAAALRVHYVHTADVDAQFASHMGLELLASEMQASPDAGAQAWGRALERFAASAAASTHSPR
jgi:hypothetical protein